MITCESGLSAGARLPFYLAIVFATSAIALGLVGIAGMLSFDVAERRGEIGLRLALGAAPARIRRAYVARGLRLGAAGIAAGALAAFGLTGVLRSLLFSVNPADPMTLVAVAALFLAVIGTALYVPARRAAGVDPLKTLRT